MATRRGFLGTLAAAAGAVAAAPPEQEKPPVGLRYNVPGGGPPAQTSFQTVPFAQFFTAWEAAPQSRTQVDVSLPNAIFVEVENGTPHLLQVEYIAASTTQSYICLLRPGRTSRRNLPFAIKTVRLTDLVYNPATTQGISRVAAVMGDRAGNELPYSTISGTPGAAAEQENRNGMVVVSSCDQPMWAEETDRSQRGENTYASQVATGLPSSLNDKVAVGSASLLGAGPFRKLIVMNPTATAINLSLTGVNGENAGSLTVPANVPFAEFDITFSSAALGTLAATQAVIGLQQTSSVPGEGQGAGV